MVYPDFSSFLHAVAHLNHEPLLGRSKSSHWTPVSSLMASIAHRSLSLPPLQLISKVMVNTLRGGREEIEDIRENVPDEGSDQPQKPRSKSN